MDDDLLDMLEELRLREEMFATIKIDQPLSADAQRVACAIPQLLPLPNYERMPRLNGKNVDLAEEWRSKGNQELSNSKEKAVSNYSRSIAMAPPGTKQLALGYLNRSAALFSLRRYEAALRDLGRAGSGGLPQESKYKLEEQKARCFNAIGCKDASQMAKKEALRLLLEAGDAVPATKAEASRSRLLQMSRRRRKPPVNDTRKPLPEVVGGCHPSIPGLSRHVDIRFSLQRGRHLVANKNILPGDVIIVEEPLAAMLLDPHFSTHCFHCMKRTLDLVPCVKCSQVMFCSEKCRGDAWSSYHNIECILMPHLECNNDMNEPSTILSLSLRLMLKTFSAHGGLDSVREKQKLLEAEQRKGPESKRIFNASGRYEPNSFRAVYYLPRVYLGGPNCTTFQTLPVHAARILIALKELSPLVPGSPNAEIAKFVGGFILRMISIRMNTNYGVGEFNGDFSLCIGNAVYAISSLINHSCAPNTFQINTHGGYAVLVAYQPIEKGEELTVSYGATFGELPLEIRRMKLCIYQFMCRCRACLEDWPTWNEPSNSRTDFTIKCNACGGRFKGPVHRSSVICTHCSHRVATPILETHKRLSIEIGKVDAHLSDILEPVREMHKVLALPNDFLAAVNEAMRLYLINKGNNCKESW